MASGETEKIETQVEAEEASSARVVLPFLAKNSDDAAGAAYCCGWPDIKFEVQH